MSENKTQIDQQAQWPSQAMPEQAQAGQMVTMGQKSEGHLGIMARWDQSAQAVKTSIDPSEQRGRALISQCLETSDLNIRNAAGQVWRVVDFFAHVVELLVEDTGEMMPKIRLVMVVEDGRMISTVSDPCIKAFAMLSQFYGPGPWNPPVLIRVREHKGKRGHSYCTLAEVVEVETAKTTNIVQQTVDAAAKAEPNGKRK